MLKYSREDSADILRDFECGIRAMDDFIHSRLDSFLKTDSRYNFYVALDESVQVRGIIKDGRLLETSFEWDDRLHCPCFNMLVYIYLPALAIFGILRILHGIGTPCGALWTYGIGMAGLPLGIYLYFRKHRRIFSKRFYEVKECIGG